MASRSAGSRAPERPSEDESEHPSSNGARGLPRALALTLASAFVWGVAHLWAGRRLAGALLMGLFALLVAAGTAVAVWLKSNPLHLAGQLDLLTTIVAGMLVLALVWVLVVVRSYMVVRPERMPTGPRTAGSVAVAVLCFAVAAPMAWAAHTTSVAHDTITSIFHSAHSNGREVDTKDPWNGERRVNVLLLGGDAAANRTGVRTDSMTVASIDTETGDTVLLSLPRNLEKVQMPEGPARDRFPYGFTGDGPGTPGLLNEVYQYAEDHPDLLPGVGKNHRGPELLKKTISGILGQRVDYYILVDMFGFADIIDAMGGVKVRITQPIPYGLEGGVLQPGYRKLKGKEALWYGRSRTDSDDYTRMGRQKCLMRAIARQADPQTVLTKFDRLAAAAKRAISTDIPQELLSPFIKLSQKVKNGAQIDSLQFVPPLIYTGNPDFALIRRLTAKALEEQSGTPSPSASASGSTSPSPSSSPSSSESSSTRSPKPHSTDASGGDDGATPSPSPSSKPVNLEASCPS
jgi:LCP family protein required for cell wall assembly